MCIIVIKEKGLPMPQREVLEECFKKNSDGCGYMYNLNGKVVIKKGFMRFKTFIKSLQQTENEVDLLNKGLVIHFRKTSSGVTSKENCHPFPVGQNMRSMRKLSFSSTLAVVHNGTINKYCELDCVLSDTLLFTNEVLNTIYDSNPKFYKNHVFLEIIRELTDSKFAFLDGNGDIYKIGDYITENDGIQYSNLDYCKSEQLFENIGIFGNDCYNDLITELYTEQEEKIEKSNFEDILDKIEFLNEGELVWSADYSTKYEGNERIILGYDNENNLYEIDFQMKTINLIEMGIHFGKAE